MICVIHYQTGPKDPDVYFGIDAKTEKSIIGDLRKTNEIVRCSSEEWFGQDDPNYDIHHWKASKKGARK